MVSVTIAYLLLSPITYGIVNLMDKYVLSSRVKHPLSYVVVVGVIHFVLGLLLLAFIPWQPLTSATLVTAITIGLLYSVQLIIYYVMFSREDVTNVVGIDYMYPVVVALLSWFFLNERIAMLGYVGLVLAIVGTLVLTVRMRQFSLSSNSFLLIGMVINTGIYEFIIKVVTPSVPELQLLAINSIFAGIGVFLLCFKSSVRTHLRESFSLWKWALLIESSTMIAILFIILAMASFPATIAAVVATLQPVVVLFGEQILSKNNKNYAKDTALGPKLIGIALICMGTTLTLLQVL